jgi:23S rRNA pseudouridine2605 synthase
MKKEKVINPLPSLTKYIAQSGVCSRRRATELVEAHKVLVNHQLALEPGYRVKPTDTVVVQGEPIQKQRKVYILINKPKDYITTTSDEKGRRCVTDLVTPFVSERLYPVGRLDRTTTGLLLMTNDGELAQKLSHPKYEVAKVYHVTLQNSLAQQHLMEIKAGLELEDGLVHVDFVDYLEKKSSIVIQLHSGKNRIVRRLFEHFGYIVKKLDRVGYAGLTKTGLTVGKWRALTAAEVHALKHPNHISAR